MSLQLRRGRTCFLPPMSCLLTHGKKDVDGRDEHGHDDAEWFAAGTMASLLSQHSDDVVSRSYPAAIGAVGGREIVLGARLAGKE